MSSTSTPRTTQKPNSSTKHPMEIASEKGRKEFNRVSDPVKAKQAAEKAKRRESFMVKRQKPKPALRPAPHIAGGPDRAAFNQKWQQERKAAAPQKTPAKRQDRKAAFKAARTNQTTSKSQTRSK